MKQSVREHWRATCEAELYDHVLGFWLENSLDRDNLGHIACLDREGRSYSMDKSVSRASACGMLSH